MAGSISEFRAPPLPFVLRTDSASERFNIEVSTTLSSEKVNSFYRILQAATPNPLVVLLLVFPFQSNLFSQPTGYQSILPVFSE